MNTKTGHTLTTAGWTPGKARTASSCRQSTFFAAPTSYTCWCFMMSTLKNQQLNRSECTTTPV